MTINAPGRRAAGVLRRRRRAARHPPRGAGRHHPERHAQGVHRAEGMDLRRAAPACASSATCWSTAPRTCRAGTRSASAATTSAKRARRRCRSWPSRWPTASATSSWAATPGLDVDVFAPRLSFFWDVHNDFFEEVAKLRAARRMWARIMRDRFGAKNPRAWMLRAHAQTAGVSLVAQQPLNNVVRTTMQALAAVLGGTQSLHTNSFDETFALADRGRGHAGAADAADHRRGIGDAGGRRSARRQLLRRVADRPHGGRGREAHPHHRRHGRHRARGRARAGRSARSRRPPTATSARSTRGERPIVGVNRHRGRRNSADPDAEDRHGPERTQIARVQRAARARDAARAREGLEGVRRACAGDANVMDAVLEAARRDATLGEICRVFRDVFGEYRDPAEV